MSKLDKSNDKVIKQAVENMEVPAMKERPIIFSSEMVKAILDNRKSQTRRVIKQQPPSDTIGFGSRNNKSEFFSLHNRPISNDMGGHGFFKCPYGKPGDRLWVRETFCHYSNKFTEKGRFACVKYKNGSHKEIDNSEYRLRKQDWWYSENRKLRWKPSIHMPRLYSRILLEITDIRVERLAEISEEDAIAEGSRVWMKSHPECLYGYSSDGCSVRNIFRDLWDSINKKRGYGWDANPWVWVIEFKGVKP